MEKTTVAEFTRAAPGCGLDLVDLPIRNGRRPTIIPARYRRWPTTEE